MLKPQGKVAVVTGAFKGIGASIAKALGAEGAAVVVNNASSKSGGKAIAVEGDVSKADRAGGLIEAAINAFGRLDVLVNNAGIYETSPIEGVTEEQYRRVI